MFLWTLQDILLPVFGAIPPGSRSFVFGDGHSFLQELQASPLAQRAGLDLTRQDQAYPSGNQTNMFRLASIKMAVLINNKPGIW